MYNVENVDAHPIENHFDPQKELLLWEKWVKIRKEETTKLSNAIGRPPADLVMNLLEEVRGDKERKIVLEHAKITEKPTVRGELWEQPERLKQRCYCEPVYEIHRTHAEMGHPSVIEHIGVPHYIQVTEKGASGEPDRITCEHLDLEYKNYRSKRESELQDNIKKIDPYRSDITDLMVKGVRPKPSTKPLPPLPDILITDDIETEHSKTNICALRINNTIIFKDTPGQNLEYLREMQGENWHQLGTNWNYCFKVPVKKLGRSELLIKNIGTVTLRYCWKKIKNPIPLIPEGVYEQVFYFNKNEDVVFPGQTKILYFTFLSDKPGIFQEFWELSLCNVIILETITNKILINLHADCYEDVGPRNARVKELKFKINNESLKNTVRKLIDEAIETATSALSQIYPYKDMLLESHLFVMKNPTYFYHQSEARKLKEWYAEMEKNKAWDLSISSWRDAMMTKEFDDRMKYYELLKSSHASLLKPWYEAEDILKEKYLAVKLLLEKLADKIDEEYYRLRDFYGTKNKTEGNRDRAINVSSLSFKGSTTTLPIDMGQSIFYIRVSEHVAEAIEMCAGILSSLDLNRWIEFDFCR